MEKDRRKDGLFVYAKFHSTRMTLAVKLAMLVLLQKQEWKVVMFDVYSKCSEHLRVVAYLHPHTSPTWPDMVRQAGDTDVNDHLYKASSEDQSSLLADLLASVRAWRLRLWHRPARRVWIHRHYLPIKRRSPVNR